eukprot:tig00000076_g2421.t1
MNILSRVAEDPQSLVSLSRVDSWFRLMLTTEFAATDELWRRAFLALPDAVLDEAEEAGVNSRDNPRRLVELAFPGPCGGCGAMRARELRTRWGLLVRACSFCFRYNTVADVELRKLGLDLELSQFESLRRAHVDGGDKGDYSLLLRSSVAAALRSIAKSSSDDQAYLEIVNDVWPRDKRKLLGIAVKAAGLPIGKASETEAFKNAVRQRIKPDPNLMKTIREEINADRKKSERIEGTPRLLAGALKELPVNPKGRREACRLLLPVFAEFARLVAEEESARAAAGAEEVRRRMLEEDATDLRKVRMCWETNSGKTHAALQALAAAPTGIYCAPLRLLAREVFPALANCSILALNCNSL